MSYYTRKIFIKNSTKIVIGKLVHAFFCLQKAKHNLYWKMEFLK